MLNSGLSEKAKFPTFKFFEKELLEDRFFISVIDPE